MIQCRQQEQYSTNTDKTYPVQSKWAMYFMHIYTGFAHIAAIAAIENRIMCQQRWLIKIHCCVLTYRKQSIRVNYMWQNKLN